MRILMTTDTIGGVWTVTRELTEGLLERGHAVALVSFGRAPSAQQQNWCGRVAASAGERFHFVASEAPLEWMQDNSRAFGAGANLLSEVGARFSADLLHAHQFCWGALPVGMPRLMTAHSDVLSWGTCCRPEGFEDSEWLRRYRWLVQRGLDGADAVVAPTHWMRDALRRYYDVPCGVTVIANGRTVLDAVGRTERRLQAVSVGRLWDEGKGLRMLLELDPPLPIVVAGEERFEGASVSAERLRGLGSLDEAGVLAVFRSSSIYIVTSLYEPFGLAPLEAALCGCAVIARDLPSLREVWGEAALFYRSAAELEMLLRDLCARPEALRDAQGRALARARQFTAARMAEQYVALYEDVLRGFGRGKTATTGELVTDAA